MRLFDLLITLNPDLAPRDAKIHLACWNGKEDPLDVYFAGGFNEWQRWQTRKNFKRNLVISLISMPGNDRWLFAGAHRSSESRWFASENLYYYVLDEDESFEELDGRLVVSFRRPGRQSYLNAEKWVEDIRVSELFRERLSIGEFPGFKAVNLSYRELQLIVRQSLQSWRTALSNVSGVYLISDTMTGQLYVGSAYGDGGIWQRWSQYGTDGHGGNSELRRLIATDGIQRAESFRFSVLETADLNASIENLLNREIHWKNVLLSRDHGLNRN